LQTICLGWLWTVMLLISASWVPRITGMSHQHLANLDFFLSTRVSALKVELLDCRVYAPEVVWILSICFLQRKARIPIISCLHKYTAFSDSIFFFLVASVLPLWGSYGF
jgi:hypothetical protein